ncbi:MAG: rod shape-determining protein MreD [SAR324 cluster bacterium]|nr:rod shape-determining protein MreD [SAR324 cluster bacterium]
MMKHIFWCIAGICGLWLEVSISSYVRIADLKINVVLIILLILMLRWKSPLLLFYGWAFGFMGDSLSHSILGVNALSFFLTLLLTRWIGEWIYDDNVLSTVLFVGLLSFAEGGVTLTLLKLLDTDLPWNFLFFKTVLPISIIHGLICPIFLIILLRFERFFHLDPENQMAASSSP